MFNPWPCTPLQTGVKILAVIDGILPLLKIVTIEISLICLLIFPPPYIQGIHDEMANVTASLWGALFISIVFIVFIIQLSLAALLYFGASLKRESNCRIWLGIMAVSTMSYSSQILLLIGVVTNGMRINAFYTSISINTGFSFLYNIYEMLVVYAYLQELKRTGMMGGYLGRGMPNYQNPPGPVAYTPYQVVGPQIPDPRAIDSQGVEPASNQIAAPQNPTA